MKINPRLLVIPLLYLLICYIYQLGRTPFYLNYVDPEYTFLFNGALIAKGWFNIEFIDHPGTPLIFISGIASILLWFFELFPPLIENLLHEPEEYLQSSIVLNLGLISLAAYKSSAIVNKYTGSIWLSILFISGLLMNQHVIDISARLIPESTLLISLVFLVALSIRYLFSSDNSRQGYYYLFPILIAFGAACKLYFLVFLFYPFILIKSGVKQKLGMLITFIISFLILAYPIFLNFERSSHWISSIFTHSGMHGGGEEKFVDLSLWPSRFSNLIQLDLIFWILMGMNLLLLIVLLSKRSKTDFEKKLGRMMIALLTSILLMSILTLKHFAAHYMMPFFFLKGILILFPLLAFRSRTITAFEFSAPRSVFLSLFFIVLSISSYQLLQANTSRINIKALVKERTEASERILNLIEEEEAAIILDPIYYGSPFKQYAMHFGLLNVYEQKKMFKTVLEKQYPNYYMNLYWAEDLSNWTEWTRIEEVLDSYKTIYIFTGVEIQSMEQLIERIQTASASSKRSYQAELIYSDQLGRKLMKIQIQENS